MACIPINTGDGTRAWISWPNAACLGPSGFTYPAESLSITTSAAGAANATSLAITANTNLFIRKKDPNFGGAFLDFVDPVTKISTPVELDNAADITGTSTSLTVKALPRAIASGSIAEWGVPFKNLTTRDYARTINSVQSQASDPITHFVGTAPGTVSATVTLNFEVGANAAYFLAKRAAESVEPVWLKIVYPQDDNNIRPETLEGLCFFSQFSKSSPNNQVQTVSSTVSFLKDTVNTYALAA
jgi:hypothetical protein